MKPVGVPHRLFFGHSTSCRDALRLLRDGCSRGSVHRPARRTKEGMRAKLVPILHSSAVDQGRHSACVNQGATIEAQSPASVAYFAGGLSRRSRAYPRGVGAVSNRNVSDSRHHSSSGPDPRRVASRFSRADRVMGMNGHSSARPGCREDSRSRCDRTCKRLRNAAAALSDVDSGLLDRIQSSGWGSGFRQRTRDFHPSTCRTSDPAATRVVMMWR